MSASTVLTVVVADGSAACIELAPAGVAVIAVPTGATMVHTNHFLDRELARGEATPHFLSTFERFQCLTTRAAALEQPDPLARVRAVAGEDDAGPLHVKPRPSAPFEQSWATKATIVLDLEQRGLAFCAGPPGAASAESWRTYPG